MKTTGYESDFIKSVKRILDKTEGEWEGFHVISEAWRCNWDEEELSEAVQFVSDCIEDPTNFAAGRKQLLALASKYRR